MITKIKKLFTSLLITQDKILTRTDILNYLIKKNNYLTYLEIGVRDPKNNFDKIIIKYKDGVDPNWIKNPKGGNKFSMTSDKYFSELKIEKVYDIIFIDGLHVFESVYNDINNSLNHLSKNGSIVIHDCNPPSEWHQRPENQFKEGEEWNGTAWKAFVKCRITKTNIKMYTIDIDCGCGIIQRGYQNKYTENTLENILTWKNFVQNKKELLNLISISEFDNQFQ